MVRRTTRRRTILGFTAAALVTSATIAVIVSVSSGKQPTNSCDALPNDSGDPTSPSGTVAKGSGPQFSNGAISLSGAFARPTDNGGELIFSITNSGAVADRLNCIVTDAARNTVVFADSMCSNDSTDVEAQTALNVPPTTIVILKPGGCIVTLEDLIGPLDARESISVALYFDSGVIDVTVPVMAPAP